MKPISIFSIVGLLGLVVSLQAYAYERPWPVNRISPSSVAPGQQVTIEGRNFGATQAGKKVTFRPAGSGAGGQTAAIVSWSDSRVVVRAPGIAPGRAFVELKQRSTRAGAGSYDYEVKGAGVVTMKEKSTGLRLDRRMIQQSAKAPSIGGRPVQVQPGLAPGLAVQRACPDPSVVDFRVSRRLGANPERPSVQFMVVVKNVGRGEWNSPDASKAQLTVRYGRKLLKPSTGSGTSRPLPRVMTPGASTRYYFYVADWNPSSPTGFSAQISYDPDITTDGNRRNDDCNLRNNSATLNADTVRRQLGI